MMLHVCLARFAPGRIYCCITSGASSRLFCTFVWFLMPLFVACQVLHCGHPGRGRWIAQILVLCPGLDLAAARDRNGQSDASRARVKYVVA